MDILPLTVIVFIILAAIAMVLTLTWPRIVSNHEAVQIEKYTNKNFVNDFFGDQIYVINLKSRPDRLKNTTQELNKMGIKFQVMEAVDSTHPDVPKVPLAPRVAGCFLSHNKVLKALLASTAEWCLIFEDDIIFPEGVNQATFEAAMMTALKYNPEAVLFGSCYTDHPKDYKFSLSVQGTQCAHAYAVNRKGAEMRLRIPIEKRKRACDFYEQDEWKVIAVTTDLDHLDREKHQTGLVFQSVSRQ